MDIKLLILTLAILSLSGGFVLAQESDKAADNQKVITVDNTDLTKAAEVGNKVCPVSGNPIPAAGEKGAMGDQPVKIAYKGKIYNLCCPMCVKDFKKNPDKYSAVADKQVSD